STREGPVFELVIHGFFHRAFDVFAQDIAFAHGRLRRHYTSLEHATPVARFNQWTISSNTAPNSPSSTALPISSAIPSARCPEASTTPCTPTPTPGRIAAFALGKRAGG